MGEPRVTLQAALACALSALSACTGEIGDGAATGPTSPAWPQVPAAQGPSPGRDGPPQAAPPPVPGQVVREQDQAMRAADPALFAVAMRYFPGEQVAAAGARLARLTRRQLEVTTRALLPNTTMPVLADGLPRDPLQTNYEYAANLSFNPANFTPYVSWSKAIAADASAGSPGLFSCTGTGIASPCDEDLLRAFLRRAFRDTGTPAQIERYLTMFTAGVAEVGEAQASAELVELALTDPLYVFRDEVTTDAGGALQPAQRLQSLTYTLTDAPPFALNVSVGDLASGSPSDALIERLLADPLAREKLERFFIAWLEVKPPAEFTIADAVFPEFTPALARAMVDETRAFLRHQLQGVAPSLKGVTQSTESFVSEALEDIYGLRRDPDADGLTALDPGERFGIFTQPGVIASHSGPSTTRLVKRGVFFTRKIMCMPLGAPPPGVDTSVPEDAGRSERQRIEAVTAAPTCQGCHAYINPFGFMQENYDPIGRFRTRAEGAPVDASVTVDLLDEGRIDVDGAVEGLTEITASMRFQQCFVRQLFRFYMGRDEAPGDDPILRQMLFSFARDGEQDMLSALKVLAGSTVISHRSEAQ